MRGKSNLSQMNLILPVLSIVQVTNISSFLSVNRGEINIKNRLLFIGIHCEILLGYEYDFTFLISKLT